MKKLLLPTLLLCLLFIGSLSAQVIQTTFLTQDFQGAGMPTGWSQTTLATDSGWKFGINTQLQSQNFAIPAHTRFACTNDDACNCNKSADRLIVDTLDLTSATGVVLKFDYFFLDKTEAASIEVSIDSGVTWAFVEYLPVSVTAWKSHLTNISAQAAGHSKVLVSFKYNDLGTFGYGLAVDNVVIYAPIAADAFLSAITPVTYSANSYGVVSSDITLGGSVTNYGAAPITNCVIKWSDGTNTYGYTLTDTIPVAGTVGFIHNHPYTVPSTSQHPIKMWVELANDTIHNNDTLNIIVTGASFKPAHKVTIEDQTICSSNNGYYSARGIVWKDSFAHSSLSSGAEIISVHTADPMADTLYSTGAATFLSGSLAWPEIQADRKSAVDPLFLFDQYNEHKNDFGVADIAVSLSYNTATRLLDVTATAHFAIDVSPTVGHYNLALVLTEDSVHSNDTAYSQNNGYSGGALGSLVGAGIDFAAQPPYVSGSLMYYMNVARKIFGTYNGTTASLPTTIAAGSTQTYTFASYTVPDTFIDTRIRAIVMLINTTTGQVLNANGAWLTPSLHTGVEDVSNSTALQVFPNPFSNETNLMFKLNKAEEVSVQVTNLLGETVSVFENTLMPSGEHTLVLNGNKLATGIYLVTLKAGNAAVTKRIMVSK